MNDSLQHALVLRLTAMADDCLILAHRNSEWVGHAPILEEDIGLANLAQDELGQAMRFYDLVEALTGQTGDTLAFQRDAADFRNVQLVELPKNDWAFTMLRQYLFDAYQHVLYSHLVSSDYQPLADAVGKFRNEELYHLRHTHTWVARLGVGSAESNRRMQDALNILWPHAFQLFAASNEDDALAAEGILPNLAALQAEWEAIVRPHLAECELIISADQQPIHHNRDSHTPHLTELLAEMQHLARRDPEARW